MKKGKIRARDYGLMILALVGCVLVSPGFSLAKEKPGAMLRLEREGGRIVRGELLEVEGESLVILDNENMAKSSQNIRELRRIVIEKKSSFLKGMGLGLLVGGGGGAALGLLSGDDERGWFSFTAGEKALMGGIGFGLLGALAGGILGGLSSADESIDLTALSDYQKKMVLNKLATKSRFSIKTPVDWG